MLKTIEKMINCGKYCKRVYSGNHSTYKCGDRLDFYYHETVVCRIDKQNKEVIFDDGGYAGHKSTTRVLKDYYYSDLVQQHLYQGYSLVDRTGSNIGGILKNKPGN